MLANVFDMLKQLPRTAYDFSRKGYLARGFSAISEPFEGQVVVTGATSGIGLATAQMLCQRGATVVMVCRNRDKATRVAKDLSVIGKAPQTIIVDLLELDTIATAVSAIQGPIAAIVHNAGALFNERAFVCHDVPRTTALHVVAPELINRSLKSQLVAGAGTVVYVSSGGMYTTKLEVEQLFSPAGSHKGATMYAIAKRAQVTRAEQWSEREAKVRFFAMHPGWADTPGVASSLPLFYRLTKRWLRSPSQGADTINWLLSSHANDLSSGAFVFDREPAPIHMFEATKSEDAVEQALASRLENLCSEILEPTSNVS